MKPTLRELGEDALIDRLVRLVPRDPDPAAGPGDDCAVVDPGKGRPLQLLKTDALVEGIHFLPGAPPRKVGWKAAARVVSDFAAMGGKPDRFLISLSIPTNWSVSYLEHLYRGIGDCLRKFGGTLAGGETTRVPDGSAAVISVSATGSARRRDLVLRSGGKPADALYVTGRLGGSIAGKHLNFTPRLEESDWLVSNFKPTAMMDLSDGLAKDLPRLATASGCGFDLTSEAVPKTRGCTLEQALGDGEDFELLFAVSPRRAAGLEAAWKAAFPRLPLTCIGRLTATGGQRLQGGWDHFA